MTIREARSWGRVFLAQSPTPELDADVLLMAVTGRDKTALLFKGGEPLAPEEEADYRAYIQARSTGLPVAYISGHKEFYGYDFLVTPDVLIPKPDTELLVEKALSVIREKLSAKKDRILTLCDMCTGSGCVGISTARAAWEEGLVTRENALALTLCDISQAALDVARTNADRLCPPALREKVRLVRTNLFQAVTGSFDIIMANPPYIPAGEVEELLADGRNEPRLALNGDIDLFGNATGEGDGLGIMRNLVPQAADQLAPAGVLLVEAGEYNAEMTEYLFRDAGLHDTGIARDLSEQLRCIWGRI